MLALTHGATQVIKKIVLSSPVSEGGGLRISGEPVDDTSLRLDLSVAESPEVGDTIVEEEGANVFVDQTVAPFLDDKVLDAAVEGEDVSFSIVESRQDWSNNGHPENFDPRGIL